MNFRRTGSASIVNALTAVLIILPAILLLFYTIHFGVNVVFWDEWNTVPLFKKFTNGTLSFSDIYAQQDEERMPFPFVIMLLLQRLTGFNTVAESVFSWILLSVTGLLLFLAYRKNSVKISSQEILLLFLPVSFLLFSFGQYESILWGHSVYMMTLGAVATFTLLEDAKRIYSKFALAILAAILASFSYLPGLMVWPVGFFQIQLLGRGTTNDRAKTLIWSLVALLAFTSYFYGWVNPSDHPPLNHVLTNPLGAVEYLMALLGAPFSSSPYIDDVKVAIGFGTILIILSVLVLSRGYAAGLLRENVVWLCLILFVALSSAVYMIGRGGFGVEEALSSRYTPITSLGIIGLYLITKSLHQRVQSAISSFSFHGLLVLILVGLLISYNVGWQTGHYIMNLRSTGAYVLKTYNIQSDANILTYLYWAPGPYWREEAKFLEQNRLNVFSEPAINTSRLVFLNYSTMFGLDTINGVVVSEHSTPIVINSSSADTITLIGWAVDARENKAASAVFVTFDGQINIPALYGSDRPYIAQGFGNPNFEFSGFWASFSSSILTKGEHTVSLKIVSWDGLYYYQTPILANLLLD